VEYGYDNLDRALELLGRSVIKLPDTSVTEWVQANLPLAQGGSIIDWSRIPAARAISVAAHDDIGALVEAFDASLSQLGVSVSGEDRVAVSWRDKGTPTLSMPLSSCRKALAYLLHVSPDTLFAALESGWCIEVDFWDTFHATIIPRGDIY